MTNRETRIERAKELVALDPSITKRGLQARIKAEFGIGLSDTTRRQVIARANTPAVLMARINSKAFTAGERKTLKEFRDRGNPPYLREVINHRWAMYSEMGRRARAEGLTFKKFLSEFRRAVRREARERGWIVRSSKDRRKFHNIVGEMLRDFRDRSIERGDYTPQPKGKPSTDKDAIMKQKSQVQEKQAAKVRSRAVEIKRANIRGWLREKDASIAASSGERRKQLLQERHRLEQSLRNIR